MTTPEPSGTSDRWWTDRVLVVTLTVAVALLWAIEATRWNATSLWADEAWSLAAVGDLWLSLRSSYGTTSFFYALLWLWGRAGTSTVWLRVFSTTVATATVVGLGVFARRFLDRRTALVAPLVLAASPMFLWTASEVRGYALETASTVLLWFGAVTVCTTRPSTTRRRWEVLVVIVSVLGPLTHGLFFAQTTAVVVWAMLDGRHRRRRVRILAPAILATLLTTAVLEFVDQGRLGATVEGGTGSLLGLIRDWYLSPVGWIAALLGLLVLLGLADTVHRRVRSSRGDGAATVTAAWIPLVWAAVPTSVLFVVRAVHTVWAPYYLTPIVPGVALLVANGVGCLTRLGSLPGRSSRALRVATSAVAVLAVAAVIGGTVRSVHPPDQDWRGAARFVATHAAPGDAIIFTTLEPDVPVASRPGFEAAWREVTHPVVPRSVSPTRPLGRVRRVDHYPTADALRRELTTPRRVWVVDYTDLLDAPDSTARIALAGRFRPELGRRFPDSIEVRLYVRHG